VTRFVRYPVPDGWDDPEEQIPVYRPVPLPAPTPAEAQEAYTHYRRRLVEWLDEDL
jgi:hypothetical protein